MRLHLPLLRLDSKNRYILTKKTWKLNGKTLTPKKKQMANKMK